MSHGPLHEIRVVDLTTIGMGPYATQILGDMGADVIKVEAPEGDIFRHAGPSRNPGMGAAFLNFNRNKRSIVLDLKDGEDKAVLLDLVRQADVFVYNIRPRSMRKLGLDYASLAALNPRLIHCGSYGYSERGPYAGKPAFDDIIQAMSGLAALQGRNGEGPRYVNTILADKVAGLTTAYAVAMALYERERSGRGQEIEVPMFETLVSFALLEHLGGETFRPALGRMGYERVLSPHRVPYPTKDGHLGLLPYTTAQWQRFFEIAGAPQYATDSRFADPAARARHVDALYEILAELLRQRTTAQWLELLRDADIPMSPVVSPEELPEDAHLCAIDFFRDVEHPSEGAMRTMDLPVRFGRTPGSLRRPAPQLDEHHDDIVRELRAGGWPGDTD